LYLVLYKYTILNTIVKLIFVAKQASREEVERWRRDYWRLREKYSNKAIAAKLGVDPGNLSALGKGTTNKKGKSKNPGAEFIKQFYMSYTELTESPEDQPADSNPNKEPQDYPQGGQPSSTVEEAQVYQMNYDETVRLRNENEWLKTEFSKETSTSLITATAFDKMAESNLNLSRVVASFHQPTHPGPDNSSRQS
jgi:hypothetical protein